MLSQSKVQKNTAYFWGYRAGRAEYKQVSGEVEDVGPTSRVGVLSKDL